MILSSFHFLRPYFLLALLPALFFIIQAYRNKSSNSAWSKAIDQHLLQALGFNKSYKKNFSNLFLTLFLVLAILALSGPTYKKMPYSQSFNKSPIIILLEVSNEMLSSDITPNRLSRAKFEITDLLTSYPQNPVGLIAFAGDAHVVSPITYDHETILSLLKELTPTIMPIDGVSLKNALLKAKEIASDNPNSKTLVMTSSNFNDDEDSILRSVNNSNLNILFWAFANNIGAPLVNNQGNFSKNANGVTISKLQEDILLQISKKSTSEYLVYTANTNNKKLTNWINNNQTFKANNTLKYDDWQDLGPYILALSLAPFLLLNFNSNFLLIFMFIILSKNADASLIDWFLRDDQKAQKLLEQNKFSDAADLFTNHEQKGAAYYKAQKFDNAIEELQKATSADGKYNLGNAYAQTGKLKEAISAYEEALKIDPKHEDAKFNKELLEKQQKQEEDKKQENKENQEEKDKQEQEQEQKQEEKQDKQDKQEQEQEQKKESKEEQEKKQDQPKEQKPSEGAKAQENKENKNNDYTKYYFEKLEQNNNKYLERKFKSETKNAKKN